MVAAAGVAICDGCIAVCSEIVAGHRSAGEIEYASWALPNSKTPNIEGCEYISTGPDGKTNCRTCGKTPKLESERQ